MAEEKYISEEDLETVDLIYSDLLEIENISELTELEKVVYLIESYNSEINSGLDFIQWFRWSDPVELKETPDALKIVGLDESYEICIEALKLTFPEGLPGTIDEKNDAVDFLEENDGQESVRGKLLKLAERQEDQNYSLTTKLASWIKGMVKQ